MRTHPSPIRHAFEIVLNLIGRGPCRSRFSPARHPDSRMRFAQYLSRVQPAVEVRPRRQAARLLGQGGALSNGVVRHAPLSDLPTGLGRPTFHLATQPGAIAARRRAFSTAHPSPFRVLLDALRLR